MVQMSIEKALAMAKSIRTAFIETCKKYGEEVGEFPEVDGVLIIWHSVNDTGNISVLGKMSIGTVISGLDQLAEAAEAERMVMKVGG